MRARDWTQLSALAVAMASGSYIRTVVSPLQEALRISLVLSDNQIAILQGPALSIPVAFASIPLGFLIDRYSRARLLIVVLSAGLVATVLTALCSGFYALLLVRALAGLASLGSIPIVFSLLSDRVSVRQRGRAATVVGIGQLVGVAVAFALGGWLLDEYGLASPTGWKHILWWLCIPQLFGLLVSASLEEPPRLGNQRQRLVFEGFLKGLRGRGVAVLVLGFGINLVEIGIGSILVWGAPMLSRSFGIPPGGVGTIMATATLVSGIIGPVVGGTGADLLHRAGGPRLVVSALSVTALAIAPASVFFYAPSSFAASVLLVTSLSLMLTVTVICVTLFTIVTPEESRGLSMSLLVASNVLFSLGIAPLAVSILSGWEGGARSISDALSAACIVAGLLASCVFAFGGRCFETGSLITAGAETPVRDLRVGSPERKVVDQVL